MTGKPSLGYVTPRQPRRGPSALLIGGLLLLAVLVLTAGGMYAMGIGPFASATPTSSLEPSPTPSATPLPVPTSPATSAATPSTLPTPSAAATPTQGPTQSAQTTDTPTDPPPSPAFTVAPTTLPGGDGAAVLLGHVPPLVAATCSPATAAAPVVAQLSCTADAGALSVEYFLYATHDEMNAAYQAFVETAQIEPDTGDCESASSWPTENGYRVGGLEVGRYLCIDSSIGPEVSPSIYWTDDRFNILGNLTHVDANRDRLLDFWTAEAGPIP